jgi:hypothetical protein
MSDFLLIVPEEWAEAENIGPMLEKYPPMLLLEIIERQSWGELDAYMEEYGFVPAGKTISAANLFSPNGEWRLWYQLIDIPGWTPPTE